VLLRLITVEATERCRRTEDSGPGTARDGKTPNAVYYSSQQQEMVTAIRSQEKTWARMGDEPHVCASRGHTSYAPPQSENLSISDCIVWHCVCSGCSVAYYVLTACFICVLRSPQFAHPILFISASSSHPLHFILFIPSSSFDHRTQIVRSVVLLSYVSRTQFLSGLVGDKFLSLVETSSLFVAGELSKFVFIASIDAIFLVFQGCYYVLSS
jgi:hypothetical protein